MIDPQKLAELKKHLSDKGIKVVTAKGESDVYMAKKIDAIVVSRDSDMMAHFNVKLVGKPWVAQGNKLMLNVYSTKSIARRAGVSKTKLKLLAIVSGNDYSKNVWDWGIFNNLRAIQGFPKIQSFEELLKLYCKRVNVPEARFDHAVSIFHNLKEDFVAQSKDPNVLRKMDFIKTSEAQTRANIQSAALKAEERIGKDKDQRNPIHPDKIIPRSDKYEASRNRFKILTWKDNEHRYGFVQVGGLNKQQRKAKGLDPEVPVVKAKAKVPATVVKAKAAVKPKRRKAKVTGSGKGRGKAGKSGGKAGKRKGRGKTHQQAFSKSSRDQSQAKKRTKGTRKKSLIDKMKNFEHKTLLLGTIRSFLLKDKEGNWDKELEKNLSDAVSFCNELKRKAQAVHELVLHYVFNEPQMVADMIGWKQCKVKARAAPKKTKTAPDSNKRAHDFKRDMASQPKSSSAATKLTARNLELFQTQILKDTFMGQTEGGGGINYWNRIMFLCYNGRLNKSDKKLQIIDFAESLFQRQDVDMTPFRLQSTLDSVTNIQGLVNYMAIDLDLEYSGIIVGRLSELMSNVIDQDDADDTEEESCAKSRRGKKEKLPGVFEQRVKSLEERLKKHEGYEALLFHQVNQLLPESLRFRSTSKSAITDCYVKIPESLLWRLLPEARQKELRKSDFTVKQRQHGKDSDSLPPVIPTGRLIEKVFRSEFGRKYAFLDQWNNNERLVLGTMIVTNGHSLSVLAFDTKTPKKRPKAKSPLSYLELAKKRTWKKFTSDPVPDWAKSNPQRVKKAGVDKGERYAIAIAVLHGNSCKLNWTIKTKALTQPTQNFNHYLDEKKKKEAPWVGQLEKDMERKPEESLEDFQKRYNDIYARLSGFYNSRAVKKASHDKENAQRSENDIAVSQILKMLGLCPNRRMDPSRNPVVFCFGDAQWGRTGVWDSFETHLIQVLRSIGVPCIFESEYFTSQKCCCCGAQTRFAGKMYRVKFCDSCSKHLHRDIMAAENMAKILDCILKGEMRPVYLCKQGDDNLSEEYSPLDFSPPSPSSSRKRRRKSHADVEDENESDADGADDDDDDGEGDEATSDGDGDEATSDDDDHSDGADSDGEDSDDEGAAAKKEVPNPGRMVTRGQSQRNKPVAAPATRKSPRLQ